MSPYPERLAHWLFDSFGVSPRPPIDLETLAARMGIDQILDTDMVEDGRLVQSSDRAVVHLRRNLNLRRRRFTLAHELAHRVLAHPQAPAVAYRRAGDGGDEERLCDQIAASILMPHDWTRKLCCEAAESEHSATHERTCPGFAQCSPCQEP